MEQNQYKTSTVFSIFTFIITSLCICERASAVSPSDLCTTAELWSATHTVNLYAFVYLILINQPEGLKDNETERRGYLITFCSCVQQTLLNGKLQQVIILISQRLVTAWTECRVICRRLEDRRVHLAVQGGRALTWKHSEVSMGNKS